MIPYEQYEKSAAYIRGKLNAQPELAVVLGSGLGKLADEIEEAVSLPYTDIPGFPRSTVPSHAGVLVCGRLQGRPVIVLSGRFHYYEGYSPETVGFYVRVLKLLGVKKLILTNAAGGVNVAYRVGDFMLISDHMKFFNMSPVRGEHQPEFGSRFFDCSRLYSPRMRAAAKQCADKMGLKIREGVYFYMPGPEFETPAEIRAIRILGGDAVGMSTAAEAVAAAQCGLEVLGITCITNMAAGVVPDSVVSDEEVTVNADKVSLLFRTWMKAIIAAV